VEEETATSRLLAAVPDGSKAGCGGKSRDADGLSVDSGRGGGVGGRASRWAVPGGRLGRLTGARLRWAPSRRTFFCIA
jgi:hypothetical protein